MQEYILAKTFHSDETVPLVTIEPLDSTYELFACTHCCIPQQLDDDSDNQYSQRGISVNPLFLKFKGRWYAKGRIVGYR